MAQFPALPFWTDAYLGDTTHLTTIEHGAYLLLLFTAWRSKGCCLPDDDKMLARYAKLGPSQWQRIRPTIEKFFKIENGVWIQPRLSDERAAVERKRDSNIRAGKVSALKRHERQSTDAPTPVQQPFNEPLTLTKTLNTNPIVPSGFDGLWSSWRSFEMPKGNKDPALKSYSKAITSGVDPETIFTAAKSYCDSCHRRRSKTQHLVTWLNQRGWESVEQAPLPQKWNERPQNRMPSPAGG